jgi:gliding motility-associated-like protein
VAIVGTQRRDENRQAVTIILDPSLEIAAAFQSRAMAYTTARDVLVLGQERLLVVGTGASLSGPNFGLVTDFDVAGTGVPTNVAMGSRVTDNSLNGVATRPGGGYYFFGRGDLCPEGQGSDGLIISIGESLIDTVANCFTTSGNARGQEFLPTSAVAGVAFDRQDPRFDPPAFTAAETSTTDYFCPKTAIFPTVLPDPLCYDAPFSLLDSVRLLSPPGSVRRIFMSLVGEDAGAMDYLEIVDVPEGVVVEGNRSQRLMLTLNEQSGESALLLEAFSRLRFGTDGQEVSGGRRVVGVNMVSVCEPEFRSFDFTLASSLPVPFGLPADTIFCPGTDLVLEGPNLPGASYRWSTGEEERSIVATAPGDYTLWVNTGCREDSATVRVSPAMDAPELIDLNVRESVCLGDSLVFVPRLEDGVTYAWADGLPGAEDRVFRAAGTYELIRTNACSAAITTVNVNFRDCCEIYLPNAFSPNGDGINDVFRAFPDTDKCGLVSNYELRVYDRWGGEVYAGETLTEGWDGGALRDQAGTGHYVYSLSYFNGLETVRRSGGVVLLR